MRFHLIDRILEVELGRSLRAVKNLTLGEEYLADHFPTFPVMPGVLMLGALIEAGAWLWRASTDFRYSVTVLREAKNVKYGTFMEPGRRMLVTVELLQQDVATATFKGKGEVDGTTTVSAQFRLGGYNRVEREGPAARTSDEQLVVGLRDAYAALLRVRSAACEVRKEDPSSTLRVPHAALESTRKDSAP